MSEQNKEREAFEAWYVPSRSATDDLAMAKAFSSGYSAALAQQPQEGMDASQSAEPVAARCEHGMEICGLCGTPPAAPVAQGLTDDQIQTVLSDLRPGWWDVPMGMTEKFARAILAQSAPRADHAGEGAEMVARKCTRCEFIGHCDCEGTAAPSASAQQAEPVEELAMMVRLLVHALRKAAPANPLSARAVDYLERHGLQGSVLRAAAAPSASPALPERIETWPAEQQGLFRKFDVRRTDGSDAPGSKHHGCRYFVLDVSHDPYAKAALTAYAAACEFTHPYLARDLREKWGASPACHHDLRAEYEGENGARAAICAKCGERVHAGVSPAAPALTDEQIKECLGEVRWSNDDAWCVDRIRALLAASPADQGGDARWIPVSQDSLPPPDTDVFVRGMDRYSGLRHDVAGMFNGIWMSQSTQDDCRFEVTHWMPIPKDAAMSASKKGA